ncbi:MAG: hypothetical protein M2R45_03106 [Verrucomicrobia subdivision 3 bacterium]|nr:hypothetical protein [Limisphaerales bacterium]MCS1413174.1 hypothetical protein [Limisphaerales bacterium]
MNVQPGRSTTRCALSLPQETVRQALQRENWHGHGSLLSFQIWMVAAFLMATNLKSVSSMKLHRDLIINHRSAWFLAHRLRVAISGEGEPLSGSVEVDEAYFGGRRRNMSNARRKELADTGRKTAVVGVKNRATKQVAACVAEPTDKATLQDFVIDHASPGTTVYSNDSSAYESLSVRPRYHRHHGRSRFQHGRQAASPPQTDRR